MQECNIRLTKEINLNKDAFDTDQHNTEKLLSAHRMKLGEHSDILLKHKDIIDEHKKGLMHNGEMLNRTNGRLDKVKELLQDEIARTSESIY